MISTIRGRSVALTSCARALSKSGLEDVDFALNPYHGCAHGCLYCYAPDVTRCKRGMDWGDWVEAKSNISRNLKNEISKVGKSVIGLATVTDPYQPAEEQLRLTKACLEIISDSDASLILMTKSPLVLRDIDIISEMKNAEVCVSITSINERISSLLEPNVPAPKARLEILKRFSEKGVRVEAMLSPLLVTQGDSTEQVMEIIGSLDKVGCNRVTIDRLRLREIGRARIEKSCTNSASAKELMEILASSENIDFEPIIQFIKNDSRFSKMKIQAPMLDWKIR